jgi:hypothetical protein
MTFNEWMEQVDCEIEQAYGLSSSDLPDWNYADAFEDGMTPVSAADEAMSHAMEF